MNQNKNKGQYYEGLAREYLLEQGLVLLNANYHCRFGEIDLIMLEQEVLCFVKRGKYADFVKVKCYA